MNKLKGGVLLTSVLALTVGCGKNNEKILIDHIQKNDGFLLTSRTTSLSYKDGKFQLGCFESSGSVQSGIIIDFKYEETVGDGYFQIKVDNYDLVAMDLTIHTSEHYYKEVELDKIYVDNTGGDKELINSIVTILLIEAKEAVNKCSMYLEDNGLPYIY